MRRGTSGRKRRVTKRQARNRGRAQRRGGVRTQDGGFLPILHLIELAGKALDCRGSKVHKQRAFSSVSYYKMRGRRSRGRRTTPHTRRRRRGRKGGFLPLALLPLVATAGKIAAAGAITGATSYGVKKALDKIAK